MTLSQKRTREAAGTAIPPPQTKAASVSNRKQKKKKKVEEYVDGGYDLLLAEGVVGGISMRASLINQASRAAGEVLRR